jgi:uncharacterized protein involved in type VI secretion and phage assembly
MSPINGVLRGLVIDNQDPDNRGRVRVRLPQGIVPGQLGWEAWAPVATPMPRNTRGTWLVPDVKDEVLLAFEGGDPRQPYVIGSLWRPSDSPPNAASTDDEQIVLRSRGGVTITLDDRSGHESVTVETPGGQKVALGDGPGSVEVTDSNGNAVTLGTFGVTVRAAAKVAVDASVIEVNAGSVSVNAGISRFSGVVQCDTLIANGVVSASYTPGAGNIW